ncbi:MAG: polysaccharide deacetylase [Candidatus Binatia bacterium]
MKRDRDRVGNRWRSVLWGLSLVVVGASPAWAQDHQHDEAVWKWTPEQLQQQVSTVRSGKSLKPKQWPNGAKAAVSISFDFDTELAWLGYAGQKSPSYLSRGEYGARAGLPRILTLLDKHKIPGTFFIPAGSMLLHPEQVQEIVKRTQHEIGFHSYVHENPLEFTGNEERETYEKAMKIVVEKTGKRPVGFRSAAWDLTPQTIQIVKEMGFLYDSSMMADDNPYALISEGKDSGLVELPVEWILDDWPYFQLNWAGHHVGLRTADDVFSIWSQEFDGAYAEGGTFILVTHPQVIGHRYRMQMLERLIEHIKKKPDVWFATHEQIARYVQEQTAK